MSLLRFIIRRLYMIIPMVFGVLILTFILSRILPGTPFLMPAIVSKPNPDYVRKLVEFYGLNQPLHIQFTRYLKNMLKGDWGVSYALAMGLPVKDFILAKFPITIEVGVYSILISSIIGVRTGVYSAVHKSRPGDTIIRTLAIFGAAIPVFLLGIFLQNLLAIKLHLFPIAGLKKVTNPDPITITSFRLIDTLITGKIGLFFDTLWHLFLPVFCLTVVQIAGVTRISRSSMLEILELDYIRSANAKGCKQKDVIKKHALKNALIPTVTVIGLRFANILAGQVLVELTFNIKGFGALFIEAITRKDYFIINGLVFLVAIVFCIVVVVVDILYAIIDPRIRFK